MGPFTKHLAGAARTAFPGEGFGSIPEVAPGWAWPVLGSRAGDTHCLLPPSCLQPCSEARVPAMPGVLQCVGRKAGRVTGLDARGRESSEHMMWLTEAEKGDDPGGSPAGCAGSLLLGEWRRKDKAVQVGKGPPTPACENAALCPHESGILFIVIISLNTNMIKPLVALPVHVSPGKREPMVHGVHGALGLVTWPLTTDSSSSGSVCRIQRGRHTARHGCGHLPAELPVLPGPDSGLAGAGAPDLGCGQRQWGDVLLQPGVLPGLPVLFPLCRL